MAENPAGENAHLHLLLESTSTSARHAQLPAIRKSLLQAFPELNGNGSYSLVKVRDRDKYLRYMCKGNSSSELPEVKWSHGLFDIPALHAAYWAENAARYKPTLSLHDHVLKRCRDENIGWERPDKIARFWVQEAVARGKPLNTFQIKSYVKLLRCELCPDEQAIDAVVAECY